MNKFMNLFLAVLMLFLSTTMHAESRARADGGDAAQKLKLMLRQISQERDMAKAQNYKLEAEIEKIKKELKTKTKKLNSTKLKLTKTSEQGRQLAERLKEGYKKLRESYEQNRELQGKLQLTTADRDETKSELGHCMKMNVQLYDAGIEAVKLYEKEASLKVEPVFQLKQVEIENKVQDYRFKMEDLTLQKASTNNHEKVVGATKAP